MLALIVDDAAPIPFVVALGERKRREIVDPAPLHAEHRVAMAIAEHGDSEGSSMRSAIRKGPLRALDFKDFAGEAEAFELGRHELSHIIVELLRARRILALGRQRDAARQHLLERA